MKEKFIREKKVRNPIRRLLHSLPEFQIILRNGAPVGSKHSLDNINVIFIPKNTLTNEIILQHEHEIYKKNEIHPYIEYEDPNQVILSTSCY